MSVKYYRIPVLDGYKHLEFSCHYDSVVVMNPDPPPSCPNETGCDGFGSNKLYQEGWAQYILTAGLPSNRCATHPYL